MVTKSNAILPDERDVAKIHAKREKEKSRRLPEASPKNAVYGIDVSQDQSYAKGGPVKLSEAARRGDGIAIRGRTKGKLY